MVGKHPARPWRAQHLEVFALLLLSRTVEAVFMKVNQ